MRLLPRYTRSVVLTYALYAAFLDLRKPCKITPKSNFRLQLGASFNQCSPYRIAK